MTSTTKEEYSKLLSQLSEKESAYNDLLKQQEELAKKIKLLSFQKNSVLDLLSSSNEQSSKEQELERLQLLHKDINIADLKKFINGEISAADVNVDPVLLYLLTIDSL